MKNTRPIVKDVILAILIGVTLGLILSLFSPGNLWLGWLGIGALGGLLSLGTIRVIRALGIDRALVILVLATIVIRVMVGVFLYRALPQFGFDNPVTKAGYVFSDAHDRDMAAYQIAINGGLFKQNLSEFREVDQYSGLLALSSIIYQFFSPDTHRPLIIVLLSAFAMGLGLVFFFTAINQKLGRKIALVACWVLALYPDGILLGSSQMREPILIGLTCLLFWVSLSWKEKPIRTLIVSVIVTMIICLFSIPAGGAAFFVVAGIVFIEWFSRQQNRKAKWIGICAFLLFLCLAGAAGWMWLKGGLKYEYYLTESASGWIVQLIWDFGTKIRIPLISIYGLFQPVLPAALVDPSLPLWRGIAVVRALGWYVVLPFIMYGIFAVFRSNKNKGLLIFISLAFAAWVMISSVRGGGDQWDNPRYRTTFLPWMAILIGWVWQRLRVQKCPWFWRFLAIEIVFLLFFLNWYINRQIDTGTNLPFATMILIILGISTVIVIGGFVWDFIKNRRKSPVIT